MKWKLIESMIDFEKVQSQLLSPFTRYINGKHFASIVAIRTQPEAAVQASVKARAETGSPDQRLAHFGADGDALEKAFIALGWSRNCWLGVTLEPDDAQPLDADRLRELLEIVDPLVIVTLDEKARKTLIASYRAEDPGLSKSFLPGTMQSILGRRFVSVEDFSAALSDSRKKQLAWAQLKQVKRP